MSSTVPFRFTMTPAWTVWVGAIDGAPHAVVERIASPAPSWAERWLDCELLTEAEAQASDWLARRPT